MELPFLLLLRELSASRIAELREMPRSFNIKLHNETQVSGRLGMSGACLGVDSLDIRLAKENALNNPPCPITPILTSSSVHHSSRELATTFLSYYNVT